MKIGTEKYRIRGNRVERRATSSVVVLQQVRTLPWKLDRQFKTKAQAHRYLNKKRATYRGH